MTNSNSKLSSASACFYPSASSTATAFYSAQPMGGLWSSNGYFSHQHQMTATVHQHHQFVQQSELEYSHFTTTSKHQAVSGVFVPSSPIPISKPAQRENMVTKSSQSPNFSLWGSAQIFTEPSSPVKQSNASTFYTEPNSPWYQRNDVDMSPQQPVSAFCFPSIVDKNYYGGNTNGTLGNGTSQSLFNNDIEQVTSPKRIPDKYHQQSGFSSAYSPTSNAHGNWFDQFQRYQHTMQAQQVATTSVPSSPTTQAVFYTNAPWVPPVSPSRANNQKTQRVFKAGRSLNFANIEVKPREQIPPSEEVTTPKSAESAESRQLYKDFSKDMKTVLENSECETDQEVFEELKRFVESSLDKRLPTSIHWRVYLFLAEHAKRHNLISEARLYYKKVNQLQPTASQGWLEHAKLEEECGNLQRCKKLITTGLQYCQTNESLLIKGIKQYAEQLNDMNGARALLARLKSVPLEKCWKIMLEGALLESRVGNVQIARKVFKYLMQNVSRHGPVYYEAYKLEERMEQYERALQIVEQGLQANPRYGPLWFAALRLYEKLALIANDGNVAGINLFQVRDCINRSVENISKELVWKVWYESAQIEERAGNLENARKSYTKSVLTCMKNLRWKVWLAGSRTELNFGNMQTSRMLLNRALVEVPAKTKAVVLIECARLEEYCGEVEKAREFLQRAQKEAKHEWKVFLESILLEMRAGEIQLAISEAEKALEIHRSTGRLWAVLIQLKQCEGEEAQLQVFKQALNEVPKSGEVWCEGARIRLNPLSPRFDLQKARQYLEFAIKFTPQYGDSFIEYLRLELLSRGPRMGRHHYQVDPTQTVEEEEGNVHIEQLCVNADPNYGPLWFHCKAHALDSSRQVLVRAKDLLMAELLRYRDIYQKAIMREYTKDIVEDSDESDVDSYHSSELSGDEGSDDEEVITAEHFTTGLYALQRLYCKSHSIKDDELRKKYIFGSEISV